MQLQALFNWSYTKIVNFISSFLHEKQNNKQAGILEMNTNIQVNICPFYFSPFRLHLQWAHLKAGAQV